jgi:hypothetical protein
MVRCAHIGDVAPREVGIVPPNITNIGQKHFMRLSWSVVFANFQKIRNIFVAIGMTYCIKL